MAVMMIMIATVMVMTMNIHKYDDAEGRVFPLLYDYYQYHRLRADPAAPGCL